MRYAKALIDDPCKIFDCSNSKSRPQHRGGGGPIQNDIMRYLHENDEDYYFKFIDDPKEAEVIITNDVFPKKIVDLHRPLIKRMCSPFFQRELSSRNGKLNAAAKLADEVIFITEYSKSHYISRYGNNLANYVVVTHWVDPKDYYVDPTVKKNDKFTLGACATDWSRPEKRLQDLIEFARVFPDVQIVLIGKTDQELPDNFVKTGYLLDPSSVNYMLNNCDGFINLSYRDAATKTVPQAINCGLPVLFADSGGVSEMVKGYGTPIKDSQSLKIEDSIPSLDVYEMIKSFAKFRKDFDSIKRELESFNAKLAFTKMLDGYFSTISSAMSYWERFQ